MGVLIFKGEKYWKRKDTGLIKQLPKRSKSSCFEIFSIFHQLFHSPTWSKSNRPRGTAVGSRLGWIPEIFFILDFHLKNGHFRQKSWKSNSLSQKANWGYKFKNEKNPEFTLIMVNRGWKWTNHRLKGIWMHVGGMDLGANCWSDLSQKPSLIYLINHFRLLHRSIGYQNSLLWSQYFLSIHPTESTNHKQRLYIHLYTPLWRHYARMIS